MAIELPQPFQEALDVAMAELRERAGLSSVLFFGSVARGVGRHGSDLDLYAITNEDRTGNVGYVAAGVPIEISFGSLPQWTARVRDERPTIVHAFATGRVLLDHSRGAVEALCAEARLLWARGPSPLSPAAILRFRFHLTDVVRDLVGMQERAPATALVASEGVRLALEAFCGAERIWMPPMRSVLASLDVQHAELVALVQQCAEGGFTASLAGRVAERVLDRLGGRLEAYDTAAGAVS